MMTPVILLEIEHMDGSLKTILDNNSEHILDRINAAKK